MARASANAEDLALTAIGTGVSSYISLHSADPGTTGASEISGGSYARVSVTWGSASAGSMANTNTLTINVPSSTTVAYFGLWSASSSGTYQCGGALSSSQTFNTAGTYSIAIGGLTIALS
jgi:hypothetical protein